MTFLPTFACKNIPQRPPTSAIEAEAIQSYHYTTAYEKRNGRKYRANIYDLIFTEEIKITHTDRQTLIVARLSTNVEVILLANVAVYTIYVSLYTHTH